ncbi:MAG: hypothetical protein ACHQ6U_00865 [Thermodesulfobacteriota bacterium]
MKEYIINSRGESAWKKIINNLPDIDTNVLESEIIQTEWYPAPLLNRLINTYDVLEGNGDFLSVIPIAVYIATKDLGPMIDALVNLKKPSVVLNSAPSLWNRYFDSGLLEVELLDAEKNYSVLYLDEIADEKTASGVAICNIAVPEWFKTGLRMAGANSAEIVHTECRYKNSKPCRFEVWWE